MTDGEELFVAGLVGKRLLRVTTAWHHHADGEPSLLHLWLHLEGLGPVRFHTPGTGLSLRIDQPHEPYSMEPHGHVTVADDAPDVPVTRFVGQRIRSVREILYRTPGSTSPPASRFSSRVGASACSPSTTS